MALPGTALGLLMTFLQMLICFSALSIEKF